MESKGEKSSRKWDLAEDDGWSGEWRVRRELNRTTRAVDYGGGGRKCTRDRQTRLSSDCRLSLPSSSRMCLRPEYVYMRKQVTRQLTVWKRLHTMQKRGSSQQDAFFFFSASRNVCASDAGREQDQSVCSFGLVIAFLWRRRWRKCPSGTRLSSLHHHDDHA